MTDKNLKHICYILVAVNICVILISMILYIKLTSIENVLQFMEIIISALTGIATICLAIVANAQNKRLMEIENTSSEIAGSSCVVLEEYKHGKVTSLSNEGESYSDSGKCLYLKFYNGGEAVLKKIDIDFDGKHFISHLSLAKGKTKKVKLLIPYNVDIDKEIWITYISCYDVSSYATFKLKSYNNRYYHKYYHYEGIKEEK